MSKRKTRITEPAFCEGLSVFVPDSGQVWTPGVIKGVSMDSLLVQTAQQEMTVNKQDVLLNCSDKLECCDNLTKLSVINSATVLNCLDLRFEQNAIYTSGGNMLVAVNPFKELEHMYGAETIKTYAAATGTSLEPHIYGSARVAYNRMVQQVGKVNQTVVVSGESGAGKTISAKNLLKYLTLVSSQHASLESSITGNMIEKKILKSNPILEAFGNATTTRNENSSRFGKFIQLNFNRSGSMRGAVVSTYLLEKTRVVHQGPSECNFHIFYQMMQGLRQETANNNQLPNSSVDKCCFRILPGLSERSAETDSKRLQDTMEALEEIGVTEVQKKQIFQILLAILYLGNIEFQTGLDEETATIKDTLDSMHGLKSASSQLHIDSKQLKQVLLHRNIQSGSKSRCSVFVKPVREAEATSRRDCLAMLLYSKLFDWLVKFINSQFRSEPCKQTIGLLDIYGFECFEQNSLEQLCINYANERLQQHYIQHFLRNLQAEYVEENIDWVYSEFEDNQPCIDMIDDTCGIFGILNEEVYLNRPTDIASVGNRIFELTKKGTTNPPATPKPQSKRERAPLTTPKFNHNNRFPPKSTLSSVRRHQGNRNGQQQKGPTFVVRHFAGVVTYRVCEMIDKNKDNIPAELETLVMSSQLEFVQQVMNCSLSGTSSADTPSKKKKTVLTKFKSSLDQLMLSLNFSDVHYVRCLKPNKESVPDKFDRPYMMSQLKASGILETVEISQQGHPARFSYTDFLQRYNIILSNKKKLQSFEPNGFSLSESFKENVAMDDFMTALSNQRLKIPSRTQRTPTPRKVMRRRTGLASSEHMMKCCAAILSAVCGLQLLTNANSLTGHFGRNKIFLSQMQFDQLESTRSAAINSKATFLQHAWKRYRHRQNLYRKKKAAMKIEKAVLMWLNRRKEQQQQQLLVMTNSLEINDTCGNTISSTDQMETKTSVSVDTKTSETVETKTTKTLENNPIDNHNRVLSNNFTLNKIKSMFTYNNQPLQPNIYDLKAEKCSQRRTSLISGLSPDPDEPPIKRLKMSCEKYTSLQNVSIGDGVISRRRLPKVGIRFHTKPSLLKNAHVINQRDLQCSLTDILPDIS